jgi:hypothetical protein
MGSKIYIHVGPPKTASTFLQKGVIEKIESKKSIVNPKVEIGGREVNFSDLFLLSPEVWDGVGRNILTEYAEVSLSEDNDLIISSEGIYGGLMTPRPWYKSRVECLTSEVNALREINGFPHHHSNAVHLERVADMASQIGFDSTKVLVTVRRQDTKLASGYAEMSSSIAGASQKNFEQWVDTILGDPVGYYGLGGAKLDYFTWWKEVAGRLGKDNILLLPMEMLGKNPRDFLQRWMEFLNLENDQEAADLIESAAEKRMRTSSESETVWRLRPPARSIEASSFRILRSVGLLSTVKGVFGWPERERKIKLHDEMSKKILKEYRGSNANLDDNVDKISIKEYEYY